MIRCNASRRSGEPLLTALIQSNQKSIPSLSYFVSAHLGVENNAENCGAWKAHTKRRGKLSSLFPKKTLQADHPSLPHLSAHPYHTTSQFTTMFTTPRRSVILVIFFKKRKNQKNKKRRGDCLRCHPKAYGSNSRGSSCSAPLYATQLIT